MYELGYELATPQVKSQLPSAQQLLAASGRIVQADVNALFDVVTAHVGYASLSYAPPSQASCAAESGYEDGTDGAAGTCQSYATNGMIENESSWVLWSSLAGASGSTR